MSTPVINEERQARAFAILGEARRIAEAAERTAAARMVARLPAGNTSAPVPLYEFELIPTPPDRDHEPALAHTALSIPLILPAGVEAVRLEMDGQPLRASLTDRIPLPDCRASCQVRFTSDLDSATTKRFRVHPASPFPGPSPVRTLKNRWLQVEFDEQTGIRSLTHAGLEVGGVDFLQPFVTYRTKKKPVVYPTTEWKLLPLPGEQWGGLQRVRLQASVPMRTPHGVFTNQFTFTFTLFDDLPHLHVEAEARYAATPATETIHNMTQKLRRLMDLRWEEVAPFQLHPVLEAPRTRPLRVWKHNYLGITAYYDLNYAQINPRNRDLDSFNHQVTAGWVAVSNGQRGLLLGENAGRLASMAFCPMRLREEKGIQRLWLNPFGSYYGEQASYAHLGATGLGADFLKAFSGFLKPNGPSYNGQTLHFSLLVAPYTGDEPPGDLQAAAAAHFYPPEIVFHAAPAGIEALLPADIHRAVEDGLRRAAVAAVGSLPAPTAFLANPSHAQVDLVWDEPRDLPLTGYEVAWRTAEASEWQTASIPPTNRWQAVGLEDSQEYRFRLRAICGEVRSDWTPERSCLPGAVTGSDVGGGFSQLPLRALVRLVTGSLWSVLRSMVKR
jgi:hypothetical protein